MIRLLVVATLLGAGLHAQAVGEPAPNKDFLNAWNVPAGHDELVDYQPANVVLLDWFGVF